MVDIKDLELDLNFNSRSIAAISSQVEPLLAATGYTLTALQINGPDLWLTIRRKGAEARATHAVYLTDSNQAYRNRVSLLGANQTLDLGTGASAFYGSMLECLKAALNAIPTYEAKYRQYVEENPSFASLPLELTSNKPVDLARKEK